MQIVHIADIHIGVNRSTRSEEYINVFNSLKLPGDSIVVLAGDIFHEKTTYRPEDINVFRRLLIRLTENNNEVVIIPGNHDVSMTNHNYMDLITPLVTPEEPKQSICDEYWPQTTEKSIWQNVHYWRRSGVYELRGMKFIHISVRCPLKTEEIIRLVPGNILLYHGGVEGAPFTKKPLITKDIMLAADLCLFGDIHERQFIFDNAAYSGSLIQQNISESCVKGFMLWTKIDKWQCQFIQAHNDKYFVDMDLTNCNTADIEKRIESLPEGEISRMRLTTNAPLAPEIENKFRERTNAPIVVNYMPNMENITKDVIIEQFTNAMKGVGLSQQSIDKTINDFLNNGVSHVHTRWYPVRMWWSNYFKYGKDNYIEFRQGIVSGIVAPNCAGKSSLFDVLVLALFNSVTRGVKSNIIKDGQNFASVTVEFISGGVSYTLDRTDTRTGSITVVKIRETETSKDITGDNLKNTYEKVEELIGDSTTMLETCTISKYGKNIFDGTPTARLANLMTVLGLDNCTKMGTKNSKLGKNLLKSIDTLNKPIITQKINIEALETELANSKLAEKDANEQLATISTEISELRDIVIKRSSNEIKDELSKLSDGELIDLEPIWRELSQWTILTPLNVTAGPVQCSPTDLAKWMAELSVLPKVESRGSYKCTSTMSLEEALNVPFAKDIEEPNPKPAPNYDISAYLQYAVIDVPAQPGNIHELFILAQPIVPVEQTPRERDIILAELSENTQSVDYSAKINILEKQLEKAQISSGFKFNHECACCIENNKYVGGQLGEIAAELVQLRDLQKQYNKYRQLTNELHDANIIKFLAALDYELMLKNEYDKYCEQRTLYNSWVKYKEACGVINNAAEKYKELASLVAGGSAYATQKINELKLLISTGQEQNNKITLRNKLLEELPCAIMSDEAKEKLRVLEEKQNKSRSDLYDIQYKIRDLTQKIQFAKEQNPIFEEYSAKKAEIEEEGKRLIEYADVLRGETFRLAIVEKHFRCLIEYTNNILRDIADFTLSVEFTNKAAYVFIHENGKIKRCIDTGSGYQQTVSEFAFKLALSEIYPHSGQFMVIDEGFNTLDEINTDKLAGFIDYIAQRYKCMLIITHNKDLARIITHHIPLVYNRFECYIRENVENPPKLDEPPQQTALGEPVIAPPIQPNGRYQCSCGAEIMNTEQKIANHKNTASHKKNMEKRGRR